MNRRERQTAIDQAYADCGAEEYAARMRAMWEVEMAGKSFDQVTRQYRLEYEDAVRCAEFDRRQRELNARLRLQARLEQLGVVRGE